MVQIFLRFLFVALIAFLAGCSTHQSIVSNLEEREANEIVVFLASKGIAAQKVQMPVSATAGAAATVEMFSIAVDGSQATDAMALLNRYGLPRRQGTTLLTLFAKSGLISSDREEEIRYQAGLAQELENTIRKIDGIIDADVQISFPPSEATALPGAPQQKTTAAVYIKHQGVMEDPNSHLEIKIKRLLSGSVTGLDYDNVAVISDRSRFADIVLQPDGEMIGPKALQQTYVSLWGIILTKSSLARFRFIFFLLVFLLLLFGAALGWMVYKFYPHMRFKKPEAGEEPEIKA